MINLFLKLIKYSYRTLEILFCIFAFLLFVYIAFTEFKDVIIMIVGAMTIFFVHELANDEL